MKKVLAIIILVVLVFLLGSISILKFYKTKEEIKYEKYYIKGKSSLVCTKNNIKEDNSVENITLNINYFDNNTVDGTLEYSYLYSNETKKNKDKLSIENTDKEYASLDEKYTGLVYSSNENGLSYTSTSIYNVEILNSENFFSNEEDYKLYSEYVFKTKNELLSNISKLKFTCK